MVENLWLFAVAGGALLLGAALVYGVLSQRRLSPSEQYRQNEKVRSFYGKPGTPGAERPEDDTDQRRTRIGPLVLALVFIVVGCAVGYYVVAQPTAPSPSVQGKEERNTQPAGPADKEALPGQQ
jgi:hypothetical protein